MAEETFSDAEELAETKPPPSMAMASASADFEDTHNHLSDHEVEDEEEEFEMPEFDAKPSHEAKIRELLRNINSVEIKLCADGCKEFIKLLRSSGGSGGELLCEYVRSSSKFTELLDAWNRQRGKQGLSYILLLISAVLGHEEGRYRPNDPDRVAISRVLDKFARSIVEEKLEDIYKELNSKDGKRQKAALLLMGSIVRRGSLLAAEVTKSFDFKLPVLPKLSEYRRKKSVVVERRKQKHSTRNAFVEFAMSFLEAGKPGLLRWVLQQREIFSGILRCLGNDDDETVVYVLSTLRDRVLTHESLVPPGLRSVLFGSVTLEQLVGIAAREGDVLAPKLAYEVLVMVCTDPSNGLMPDLNRQPTPLKGNMKRLVDLMKKLKATEIEYHRNLLLAIVHGRPSLCSSYLDEFPYNLEDNTSSTWLSAVTLAANVVSAVRAGISWDFLNHQAHDMLAFESSDVQSVFKCVCPRPFSRLVVNKGLLHSDPLIKHGTLRLLLEVLKLFNSFVNALNINGLSSLKQKLQDEARIVLPDPQVLFTLLSSLSSTYKSSRSSLKRTADSENIGRKGVVARKKMKFAVVDEDIDIVVGGLNTDSENVLPEESEKQREGVTVSQFEDNSDDEKLMEIWGSYEDSFSSDIVKNAEVFFHCKVLEALMMFHRTLRAVLEGSYDFLKILPSNPLELPSILLQSLLSMLIEQLGCSQESGFPSTLLPPIYKHLQSFLNLSIHASIRDIKEQAYVLAKAAMLSSGAFDHNPWEIEAWFLFLPGDGGHNDRGECGNSELLQSLSSVVVSFLCDAVSTVGNNLVKYWADLKCRLSNLEIIKDTNVDFNPLVICVLEKCLRLLTSDSATFTLPEKSMISLYVCNTLKYLLQTQVEAQVLAAVILQLLSERIEDRISAVADAPNYLCEWRPLVYLFLFSQSIICKETCNVSFDDRVTLQTSSSFVNILGEVERLLSGGSTELFGVSKALYLAIICATPDDIMNSLPSIMAVVGKLPGVHQSFMNYFFLDQSLLSRVSKLWPEMFSSGLGMSVPQLTEDNNNQTTIKTRCTDFESQESASSVFGSLLKEAPFDILFPAVIFCHLQRYSEIRELLLAKLSNLRIEHSVSSVRLVLFWLHEIHSTYRKKPSEQLECLSEICCTLVSHIFAQLLARKVDPETSTIAGVPLFLCIQELARTVFSHPAVTSTLSCPFGHDYNLSEEFLRDASEGLMRLSGQRISKMELHVLNLLTATSDNLLALCSMEYSSSAYTECKEDIVKTFRKLFNWIILIFKDRFNLWCRNQDMTLCPILYAVVALMRLISPVELLELANWMLAGVELPDSISWEGSNVSPACLAVSIGSAAFDMLLEYLRPPNKKVVLSDMLIGERSLDATLFESIYLKAFEFATSFRVDLADVCLLKALTAAQELTNRRELLPFSMEMTRVVVRTPLSIVSHCFHRINSTKVKVLNRMIEISPLHLSTFARFFLDILNKNIAPKVNSAAEKQNQALSDEDCLMLMPVAISYISRTKPRESLRNLDYMFSSYSRILLDGLFHWRHFVSRSVFQLECGNILPSSVENLHDLFSSSLLGEAVHMLQLYFGLSGDHMNERVKLFCAICPSSDAVDDFLDFDVRDIDSYSIDQLLNLINRVAAKTSLCLVLLFPQSNENSSPKEAHNEENTSIVGSSKEDSLQLRLLDMLVFVWQRIVKRFPPTSYHAEQMNPASLLLRSLEVFIQKCIYRLVTKMHNVLIQMDSLPFVEKMAKLSLLHRFGDLTTLENLRHILSSLSDGNLPVDLFLQLLLGHSQLAQTIDTVSDSSHSNVVGMVVKPISSFLRSSNVTNEKRSSEESERYKRRLEVIKLLRLLFQLRARQHGSVTEDDLGVNTRELVLLLLGVYGATVSEIDMEIYMLLSEIESARGTDNSIIADLDYLWGNAALRTKKVHAMEHVLLDSDMSDAEQDCRQSQFRDNLPIDPKLIIGTILYFPYGRSASEKSLFRDSFHRDTGNNMLEGLSGEIERIGCYDPAFVLSFSIHSLSMGYLDPVEFAGLGLLAISLVGIASPQDQIRKLGYEVLGRFKDALMGCPKKREVTRLKLLLTYIQNGIEEPWQKIPTIAAVFVAEASVVLLDPSHDHYSTISKLLMQSPRMNLKSIPLFHDIFWSCSTNFKTERLWMLRLLYVGINLEDDAQIYIRNSVLESLLSVYASPLSDKEAKELILQIIKKCVKLEKMARFLVENCCLIPWLSSALSSSLSLADGQDKFLSNQLICLIEVVHEIMSFTSTMEWLQKHGLEQLSELSCHLFNLLVRCSKLVQETKGLVILILDVIESAFKISQERKLYQPHFTPSIRSLYQLYQAIDLDDDEKSSRCAECGLKAILMNMPPTKISDLDNEELSKFLVWAVSTAVRSDSLQAPRQKDLSLKLMCIEENIRGETMISTLLRWLVASVILWRVSSSHGDSDSSFVLTRGKRKTLRSLMEHLEGRESKPLLDCEAILAGTIFHLQQLLGMNCRVLPSVVAALSILVLADTSGSSTATSFENPVPSLWSKICCPPEANPAWRWSFYQPWADVSAERTDLEKLDELHACQKLLVVISGVLGKKSLDLDQQLVSLRELESSGVFEWERSSILQKE